MRLQETALILAVSVGLAATDSSISSADWEHVMAQRAAGTAAKHPGNDDMVPKSMQVERAEPIRSLSFHHASLLPRPHIYAIYWGDPSKFPSDFLAGMNDFLRAYGGTVYTKIMTQYLVPEGYLSALPSYTPTADSWVDTSKPPAGGGVIAIGNEACSFAKQVGRRPGSQGFVRDYDFEFSCPGQFLRMARFWVVHNSTFHNISNRLLA